jgi:hypothetical protein
MKGEEEDENHAICKFYTWPLHVEFRIYMMSAKYGVFGPLDLH